MNDEDDWETDGYYDENGKFIPWDEDDDSFDEYDMGAWMGVFSTFL